MVINKLKRYIFYFLFFIFIGFNCYSQGDSLNYYNEKVNASFEEKNYNNALKYAQCVLSKDSLNQNAIFKKAESQFYSNLYLESIKTAQFIIRNKIGNQIHILTIKGIAEDMVFNYRQSNLDFKELLKIDSINRVAFYRIGYNNYYLRDFVTAEKYLKKAYKLNPNIFEPIKYLAESYIKLHNNDSALHYFEKALAINNNAEDILVGKSKVYYALQKYTMAESLLIKANNIKETYDAYLNLAIIYEVIGNNTKWYESLVKLKQFNKSTEDELLSEIKFLFKVNEFQSILEKTNEIIPKHTLNLNYFIYFRGKAHEGLKEYENAINDFKTVEYKLNGAYNVSLSIGLCYEKMKKYDLALPYYYEAVKQMPDNKDALYYKSKLCFEMKKFEESKQGFLKLLKYKESPEIYDKLVNISFMKKNNNQALIYSDKGLSISKKGSEDEFTLTADKINSLLMLKDYKTALNIIDNFKTDDVSLLP
jgi:tetratricopeptide (TPR) repeat protein